MTKSLETELKNRSRRAFRALHEANHGRLILVENRYDGIAHEILSDVVQARVAYADVYTALTGEIPIPTAMDVQTGEEAAASYAPHNPEDVAEARDRAADLRDVGLRSLRLVEKAVDRHHIEANSNGHRKLRNAAVRIVGNSEAILDAVSDDFERDAARLAE